MSDADEIPLLVASLASPDPEERVAVLKVLVEDPTGDARIIAALEPLLEDRTACILMLPSVYGELRWLAAQALAAELRAAGSERRVWLPDVAVPLTMQQLAALVDQSYGGRLGGATLLQEFVRLQRDNLLPRTELRL